MNKLKKSKFLSLILVIGMLFSLLTGCSTSSNGSNQVNQNKETVKVESNLASNENIKTNSNLKVHFINVGQADCILVQDGNSNMLIDAGNNNDSNTVISYLKKQNINKLDYVIGTHPHEDHIGSLDDVIKEFNIGKVYMPKVTHTSKTFKDVVNAIKNKNLSITTPTPGTSFTLGSSTATILAPNSSEYEDLNNYSIVIKLTHGNNSFMFTGDAEDVSEKEMIKKGFDLKADVLKLGHHGSSSSSTVEFLNKVNPKYAVIMTEKNNSYGHPHKEVMDKLKSKGITVYRTDENNTIVATSDGNKISFNTSKGSYLYGRASSNSNIKENTNNTKPSTNSNNSKIESSKASTSDKKKVYYTPNGKSYHLTSQCRTLSRSKTILSGTLEEAISSGHADPCDVCN